MVDKIGDCINDLVSMADGPHPIGEREELAKRRIDALLADADAQVGSHAEALGDLRDRLGGELNKHHGSTREFLDKIIEHVNRLRGRS
jgi:hypothetical protein